jgi:hypothetical protein
MPKGATAHHTLCVCGIQRLVSFVDRILPFLLFWSQINPVNSLSACLKIRVNIILPSVFWVCQFFLLFRFLCQDPVWTCLLPYVPHVLFIFFLLYLINQVIFGEEYKYKLWSCSSFSFVQPPNMFSLGKLVECILPMLFSVRDYFIPTQSEPNCCYMCYTLYILR